MGLKILHGCSTAMAGAPVHLSNIINKYTEHSSVSILARTFHSKDLANLSWKYDYVNPNPLKLKELVEWCDLIHYHNKPIYNGQTFDKPSLLQFHSQPEHHGGYRPLKSYSEYNGRKLVVAQYHPRFYTDARIVPNMIDIWDTTFTEYIHRKDDKISIFFGWASEVKTGSRWAYKGTDEIIKVLDCFKDKCNIHIVTNTPYETMMRIKCGSHIVIGDCITGSYHLNDLEGAAVGAVTFNCLDEKTEECMKLVSKVNDFPFQRSNLENLYFEIDKLISDIDKIKCIGKQNRIWMENHWNPKNLVNIFIDSYKNLLSKGIVE